MNQKIHEAGLFDDIFVPPHTSDAGLALGAAAILSLARAGRRPLPMAHCFWGPSYANEEIEKVLRACGAPYQRPDDIASAVAEELARGTIVGWFQQGLEFGPRALGARSILADPRQPDMKDRVNFAVKFREGFRPFAPSVLEEEADAWFEGCRPTPYMTMTFDVKPPKRALVPAITHVDGTARVQTVSRTGSPHYHDVIAKFARLAGVPMVLNTSMNVKGQPIVADPRTALSLFYGTGLGSMAIGPYLLRK
jgi:carbamoyltransferase